MMAISTSDNRLRVATDLQNALRKGCGYASLDPQDLMGLDILCHNLADMVVCGKSAFGPSIIAADAKRKAVKKAFDDVWQAGEQS